jgi:hypothetical protein
MSWSMGESARVVEAQPDRNIWIKLTITKMSGVVAVIEKAQKVEIDSAWVIVSVDGTTRWWSRYAIDSIHVVTYQEVVIARKRQPGTVSDPR